MEEAFEAGLFAFASMVYYGWCTVVSTSTRAGTSTDASFDMFSPLDVADVQPLRALKAQPVRPAKDSAYTSPRGALDKHGVSHDNRWCQMLVVEEPDSQPQ